MKDWIAAITSRYWKETALLLVLQAGSAVLVSLQPLYFQKIVSLAVGDTASGLLVKGLPLVAMLAALYFAGTLLQSLGGYIASLFSSNLLKQLQTDFFEKISRLPLYYFQHRSGGEFFTKFNNDIGHTQSFIARFLPSALREIITAIAVTAILFYSCPAALTFIALSIVAVTSLMIVKLNKIMKRYAEQQREGLSEINKVFDETVQGIDTLKTFASERQRSGLFQKHTSRFRDLSVRAGTIAAVFSPGIDLVAKFGGLLLIFVAYYMIARGDILSEQFLLFFFYSGLLQASVSTLVGSFTNIQPQIVGIGNIAAFFTEPAEDEGESGKAGVSLNESVPVDIKGLSFSYPGGRMLYSSADLFIPARGITVIHGPSGSGKSTLINLLLRFYDPERGTIRFGDADINEFHRAELRGKISVVTQYHFIFHDTLEMNLRVARPDASDEEIINALKRAHLGEFLRLLPNGINAIMDPRGKGISGGEKQRICIARLLLRNSPVMIFDEPWSNLDDEARGILVDMINTLKSDTTILILTHDNRPELDADMVFRLSSEEGIFIREG